MGGVDKGWLDFHGKALVEHVVERFAQQVDEVIVSANRNLDRYRTLGYLVVQDRLPGFAGPLAGLQAAMAHARFDLVATVPCDSPLLPLDLVEHLRKGLLGSSAAVAVARAGGRRHPAFSLSRKDVLVELDRYLHSGQRAYGRWIERCAHIEVEFDNELAFSNVNAPADMSTLTGNSE
jgi:molybdopterin-guanine dinucleotide biosynthesis protein A